LREIGPVRWLRRRARLVRARRGRRRRRAAPLDLRLQLLQTAAVERRCRVGDLRHVADDVDVIADFLLQVRLDGHLRQDAARVLRDVLEHADHRVGLLGQVKQELRGRGLDGRDRVECGEGLREPGLHVVVERVHAGLDLRGGVHLRDRVVVKLVELPVDRHELVEYVVDRCHLSAP